MNVYFSIYGNGASGPLFKRGPMGGCPGGQSARACTHKPTAKCGVGCAAQRPLLTQSGHNIRREFAHNYAPAGSVRSAPRRTLADPTPISFTIAMAWAIVMPNGRTRSAGRYITLPDIGVGA